MKSSLRSKALLVAAGMALGLAFVEAALRLAKIVVVDIHTRGEQAVLARESANFRSRLSPATDALPKIVCVGDSHTYGIGAPAGNSYPVFLQESLRRSGYRYTVVNSGIPGLTAVKLRRLVPEILATYRPAVLIVLIGKNDMWYPFVSDLYELSRDTSPGIMTEIANIAGRSKTVKLAEYVYYGIKRRWSSGSGKKNSETRKLSEKYIGLSYEAHAADRPKEAEEYLLLAEKADPSNEHIHITRGHFYQIQWRYDRSIAEFEKAMDLNPYSEYRAHLYRVLFLMYHITDPSYHERIRSLMRRIPSDERFALPREALVLNEEEIRKNLAENIDMIISLVRRQGVQPVLMTYARGTINDELRTTARRNNVPLVDNEAIFAGYPDAERFYSSDGSHPSAEGYRIIAGEAQRQLRRILDARPAAAAR